MEQLFLVLREGLENHLVLTYRRDLFFVLCHFEVMLVCRQLVPQPARCSIDCKISTLYGVGLRGRRHPPEGLSYVFRNISPNEIYVARNGESELTSLSLTDQQVRDLVERMLKSSDRPVFAVCGRRPA